MSGHWKRDFIPGDGSALAEKGSDKNEAKQVTFDQAFIDQTLLNCQSEKKTKKPVSVFYSKADFFRI